MIQRHLPSGLVAILTAVTLILLALGSESASAQLYYPYLGPIQVSAGGPYSGNVGNPVTLTATTLTALPSAPVSYTWSLGDGTVGYGQALTHIYSAPGTYYITLNGASIYGYANSDAVATISNNLQVSAGVATSGLVGTPIPFAASFTGNFAPQFSWTFGDGTSGTGQATTHVYTLPGTYTASVTASSAGQSDSDSIAVTVRQGLVVDANGPYRGVVGSPIQFGATVNGATNPQYSWSFGDGGSASGPSPTHVYSTANTFAVSVLVTDQSTGQDASDTAAAAIELTGPIVYYPAGWNLVSGPAGTTFAKSATPLYSLQPGDADYTVVRAGVGVRPGYGYWAYFPQATSMPLTGVSTDSAAVQVPGGQWILMGNPSATSAVKIHDASYAVGWDPISGTYKQVSSLAPGNAAWVYVSSTDVVSVEP
jgi:PKD repeat protein